MKRIATAAAGAALGLALLTGCGGDGDGGGDGGGDAASGDDYCTTLEEARDEIEALDTGDAAALARVRELAGELEQDAPSEVQDEWALLNDAFEQIDAALGKSGLDMEDLPELQSGQLPEGVDQQQLQQAMQELSRVMQGLGEEFQTAGDTITQHAKDECDIDLDQSPAPEGEPSQ